MKKLLISLTDDAPVRNNYDFSDDLYDDDYPDHLSQDVDDLIPIDGQPEDIPRLEETFIEDYCFFLW